MSNNDPSRQMAGQPPSGGQQMPQQPPGGQQQQQQQPHHEPLTEVDVPSPTLCRRTVSHPQQTIGLAEDDWVIESYYDPQMDVWEVLVLLQPREHERGRDDEEEEEED